MGGLGNQLFQIFTTISYAIKLRTTFKFLNIHELGGGSTTKRYTFWNSLLYKLQPFLIDNLPEDILIIREKNYNFNDIIILDKDKNIILFGYFQSYKYFYNNMDIIYRLLNLQLLKNNVLNKLHININDLANTVSIHFRIGDYKNIQSYHPILKREYYKNSLQQISNFSQNKEKETMKILYFCEDEDIDDVNGKISYLRDCFPNYTFVRGESSLTDWEQMLLMSCCHHNIIANSSFSWWSAYLNNWHDKIVCYPSEWFGELAKHNTDDLCPDEWVKIIC